MFHSRSIFLALAGLGGAALLPAAAHASDFSGAKIGVHADYLWSKVSPSGFANAGDTDLKGYDANKGGGGASIGYDWQSNNMVYGVFASITATKLKGSTSQALTVHENEGTTIEHHGFDTDLSQLAMVGGRVGVVVNDNTLLYAQAAVASGHLKIHETGDNATANSSHSRSGYAIGVGTEMQLNDKWSVGVEWNHYDLGKASFAPAAYGAGKIGVRGETVGINLKYRF